MLLDAFEELSSEKSMENISVSEICERSTVRRNTFYRHFSDKYAFVQFYLQSITERFMAEAEPERDLDDIFEYAQHMHRALIRFVLSDQQVMKYAIGSTASVGTIDMIVKQTAEGIAKRAAQGLASSESKAGSKTGSQTDAPVQFLAYFYSAGMVYTLRWWFFEGKPISADQLEQYCTNFLMRCYTGLER